MTSYREPYAPPIRSSPQGESFGWTHDQRSPSNAVPYSASFPRPAESFDSHMRRHGRRQSQERRRATRSLHHDEALSPRLYPRSTRHWPPRPTCEDEVTSLSREAFSERLLKSIARDGVVCRGRVDQEPILEDSLGTETARRPFVTPPRSETSGSESSKSSREQRQRREQTRRPSKLDMSFGADAPTGRTPQMTKPQGSPYAFAPTSRGPLVDSPGARGTPFDFLTPQASDSRSRPSTSPQPSSPRRDSGRATPSSKRDLDYFSSHHGQSSRGPAYPSAETHRAPEGTGRRRPHQAYDDFERPTNPSATWNDKSSSHTRRRPHESGSRRYTETLEGRSHVSTQRPVHEPHPSLPSKMGGHRAPSVSTTGSESQTPKSATDSSFRRSHDGSRQSSRASSPTAGPGSIRQGTTRSTRNSSEAPRDYGNKLSSPTSQASSVSGSRPSSPSPRTPSETSRLPKTDVDWSSILSANAARRPKAPSRLSSLLQVDSTSVNPRSGRDPAEQTQRWSQGKPNLLPYPLDDGPTTPLVQMPEERQFQFLPETSRPSVRAPEKRASLQTPASSDQSHQGKATSPNRSQTVHLASQDTPRSVRPPYQNYRSSCEVPQIAQRGQAVQRPCGSSRTMSLGYAPAPREAQPFSRFRPRCSRAVPKLGYSDWSTIHGAEDLDFCPECTIAMSDWVDSRSWFKRSVSRGRNVSVQCALGGDPWIRFAWNLTLQRRKSDLSLVKEIAHIEETSERCSGSAPQARIWFGIRNCDYEFVPGFQVCHCDVRKIDFLMPEVKDLLVRMPASMCDDRRLCSTRRNSNRLHEYLECLLKTHNRARDAGKDADPGRLISLAKRLSRLRECPGDGICVGALWHYMEDLPELTVCEECFDLIVEPEAQKERELALMFNRAVARAYREGKGSSCQLYSTRMRQIFRTAVDENDYDYLARKAKERRGVEERLQDQLDDAMAEHAAALQYYGERSDSAWRTERELERVKERVWLEWMQYE